MMYKIHNSPIMINHEKHQAVKGRTPVNILTWFQNILHLFKGFQKKRKAKPS